MIGAVILEGNDFDDSEKLRDADFPVIPRVGETITLPVGKHYRVVAVNHHLLNMSAGAEIQILVQYIAPEDDGPMPMVF